MGTLHEQRFESALTAQNYYVVVPVDVANNDLVQNHATKHGLKFADHEALSHVVADAVLQPHEGWEDVNPDTKLLATGSAEEIARLEVAISKRRKFIITALGQTSFSVDAGTGIEYQGEKVTPSEKANILIPVLERSKTAQDQIWAWISARAEEEGGVLALGDSPSRVDSTKFQILRPYLPENLAPEDITPVVVTSQSKSLTLHAAKNLRAQRRVSKEQSRLGIPRNEFAWCGNDLIGGIRAIANPLITEACDTFRESGVTEFDVAAQVMMHLPAHEPTEIWKGDDATVRQICKLLDEGDGLEANALLDKALAAGKLEPNMGFIKTEVLRHAQKLATHYQDLSVLLNGNRVELPAEYMGNPEQNPFRNIERSEINAQNRMTSNEHTPEEAMEVTEKHTGKRIIFKAIPPEISKLYSLGFSNLHYAREGEIGAFGAFLEDDDLPFAYSAYSPVTRQYAKDMLRYLDTDPSTIVESTRAWNAPWAPENTMSTLFAYAHSMLKAERIRAIKAGTAEQELAGVVTSINPNLGFKAVSFRGVRFNVAGIKPTGFTYFRESDGAVDFMPTAEIRAKLNLDADSKLEEHPQFLTPQIPLLPTLEFLALFNNAAEKNLLSKPIYRITPAAAKRN